MYDSGAMKSGTKKLGVGRGKCLSQRFYAKLRIRKRMKLDLEKGPFDEELDQARTEDP